MANLRVDKITSTETFETTGSVQFGNDNALKISANSDFDLTSNDFTMESWIYMNSVESFQTLLMYTVDGTEDDTSFQFDITSTQLRFVAYVSNSSEVYGSNFSFGSGTWYHVAATRTNDLVRLFVDGDLIGTHNFVSTIDTEASAELNIGYRNNNGTMDREVFGHLTNVRIINGKALYTANFKPPMRELEVIPGTSLLACQSKTDASLEKTGKTITVLGNAVASELTPGILTPVPKDGAGSAITGSVEFNGSTNYLGLPTTTDFTFGTNDWTIEFWLNPGENSSNYTIILALTSSTNTDRFEVAYHSSTIQVYTDTGAWRDTGITPSKGDWHHIAFVRNYSGNSLIMYLNGVNRWEVTNTRDYDELFTTAEIGSYASSSYGYLQGFISNFRIVNGNALYTDDFIPPTRELKKVPGTVLLCCQDPDSPFTEATGKTIVGYGDLQNGPGVNFVKNGDFSDGTTNWVADSGANISATGGVATITNGGGDNLYAIKQEDVLIIGKRYRFTGTIVPTFSSGTANFRVRAGGSAVSYSTTALTNGETFNFDTGEVVADGANLEIGSGTSSDMTQFTLTNVYGETLDSTEASNFTPQVGDDRQVTFEGVTKINSDAYFYLPTGDTESREATGTYNAGTRGIFGGGFIGPSAGSQRDTIQYINIASTGDATDAGDLTQARYGNAALASATRAVWAAGTNPSPATYNIIDAVEIMSTGNAFDFGDLYATVYYPGGVSNRTRGIYGGGYNPSDDPSGFKNNIG